MRVLMGLSVLALVGAVSLATTTGAMAQVVADDAHGTGTIEGWPHCPSTSTTTFDFSATSGPSGENASGVFSFACSPTGFPASSFSGTVSCLAVDGNEATLGGTVSASTAGLFPVGTELSFTVKDGGPAGIGDAISVLRQGSNCVVDTPNRPISSGDIVVQDASAASSDPVTLTLDPATATNTIGETHCVTATVTDAFANPTPGVTVEFSVPTAVATFASPSSGSDVTDADGEAEFCYAASLPGEDVIHAFADTNGNDSQDPLEPFGDATKTWLPPASSELCEVKITHGGWIIAANGDPASFGGNARVDADGVAQGQQQYTDHGPAQPRDLHSIELLATTCSEDLTTASIFGTATIDGAGLFVFRIDATDPGEPGNDDTYGIIMSDGYASGQKQLQGGNVRIHRS